MHTTGYPLDEGAGTRAGAASGSGNHGTATGGPQWVPGKIGGALSFDGVGDFADCGKAGGFA